LEPAGERKRDKVAVVMFWLLFIKMMGGLINNVVTTLCLKHNVIG
jgi:hypothetical protein